jgi:serine/threonine-protein kinase ULK/ATG1
MAPEVLEGRKYDAKADLWSVGTILYEMLFSRPPYMANNILELTQKIKQGPPRFSSSTFTVNPEAIDLLKGLLQSDPSKRMTHEQFYAHPYLAFSLADNNTRPTPAKTPTPVVVQPTVKPTENMVIDQSITSDKTGAISDSSIISPSNKIRPPKTSPFVGGTNLELSQHGSQEKESFIIVDKLPEEVQSHINASLSTMLILTSSGHISYPNMIFDFSLLRRTTDPKNLDEVEAKCKRSYAIAEAAFLMDRYDKQMEALCLYTRALDALNEAYKLLNIDQITNDRTTAVVMWIRARYTELLEWADKLSYKLQSSQSSLSSIHSSGTLVTSCAEDILYKYAIKLAKEAAYNEYDNAQQCSAMYLRSKLVFEHLLYDSNIRDSSDQQMLDEYIKNFDKRMQVTAK